MKYNKLLLLISLIMFGLYSSNISKSNDRFLEEAQNEESAVDSTVVADSSVSENSQQNNQESTVSSNFSSSSVIEITDSEELSSQDIEDSSATTLDSTENNETSGSSTDVIEITDSEVSSNSTSDSIPSSSEDSSSSSSASSTITIDTINNYDKSSEYPKGYITEVKYLLNSSECFKKFVYPYISKLSGSLQASILYSIQQNSSNDETTDKYCLNPETFMKYYSNGVKKTWKYFASILGDNMKKIRKGVSCAIAESKSKKIDYNFASIVEPNSKISQNISIFLKCASRFTTERLRFLIMPIEDIEKLQLTTHSSDSTSVIGYKVNLDEAKTLVECFIDFVNSDSKYNASYYNNLYNKVFTPLAESDKCKINNDDYCWTNPNSIKKAYPKYTTEDWTVIESDEKTDVEKNKYKDVLAYLQKAENIYDRIKNMSIQKAHTIIIECELQQVKQLKDIVPEDSDSSTGSDSSESFDSSSSSASSGSSDSSSSSSSSGSSDSSSSSSDSSSSEISDSASSKSSDSSSSEVSDSPLSESSDSSSKEASDNLSESEMSNEASEISSITSVSSSNLRRRLDIDTETTGSSEVTENTESIGSSETSETIEPHETSETSEPSETSETSEPSETSETSDPSETSGSSEESTSSSLSISESDSSSISESDSSSSSSSISESDSSSSSKSTSSSSSSSSSIIDTKDLIDFPEILVNINDSCYYGLQNKCKKEFFDDFNLKFNKLLLLPIECTSFDLKKDLEDQAFIEKCFSYICKTFGNEDCFSIEFEKILSLYEYLPILEEEPLKTRLLEISSFIMNESESKVDSKNSELNALDSDVVADSDIEIDGNSQSKLVNTNDRIDEIEKDADTMKDNSLFLSINIIVILIGFIFMH